MAERAKDEADLKLEAMFQTAPIADDGFSEQVVSRVRRQVWIRRLSLPVGIGLGLAIGAKPLLEVAAVVPGLLTSIFGSSFDFSQLPLDRLPQGSTMLFGATLLMALLLAGRLLEE